MSGYKLVNVSATERLSQGDTLRITFSKMPYLINDRQFASHVNGIYEQLIGASYSPVSPNPSIADGQPVVIDIRMLTSEVLADVASELESIAGVWVSVSQIEKLSPAAAAVASSNEGAKQRQSVSDDQSKKNDVSGFFGDIQRFLGEAKHAVILIAVVAIVIALIMYHKEIAAGAKKLHWDT